MKNRLLILSIFCCSIASMNLNASIFDIESEDDTKNKSNPVQDKNSDPVVNEQPSFLNDIDISEPASPASFNQTDRTIQHLTLLGSDASYSSPASQNFCQNMETTFKKIGDPIPIVDWVNAMQLDSFYQTTFHRLPFEKKYHVSTQPQGCYTLALEPYGFSSKFKLRGQNFNLKTLGITTNANFTIQDSWVLGGGVGYSHSNLNWQHVAKKTRVSSVYFGPQLTYLMKSGYLQLMLAGIYNIYDVYSSLITHLKTSSDRTGWDILAKVGGGVDIEVGSPAFFIQPNIDLRYLGVIQNTYKEKASNGLKDKVKNGYTDFFRSRLALEFWKEFYKKNSVFFIPSLSIGWISMQPLSEGKKTVCKQRHRTVPQTYPHSNQLYVGAKLTIYKKGFLVTLGVDGNIAKVYPVWMGNVRFETNW